jgi:hypothetical protein
MPKLAALRFLTAAPTAPNPSSLLEMHLNLVLFVMIATIAVYPVLVVIAYFRFGYKAAIGMTAVGLLLRFLCRVYFKLLDEYRKSQLASNKTAEKGQRPRVIFGLEEKTILNPDTDFGESFSRLKN